MEDDALAPVADRLYGLPPEEFTAARDAAAEEASGDLRKAVKALRRPTASAWLVNRLARDQPDLLEELLALGPALAEAQARRSGEELRALGTQRRDLVQAVTGTVAADATAAVRTEVEQTLEAALADPSAADAVRSGTLVRPLQFAGFGGVDVDGAVAVPRRPAPAKRPAKGPAKGPAKRPAKGPAKELAQAEQAALDAAAALDDAVGAADTARRRLADAERDAAAADVRRAEAQQAVDDLEQQLAEAREALAQAGHAARDAQRGADAARQAAERAVRRVEAAQDAAGQARTRLDALRRG